MPEHVIAVFKPDMWMESIVYHYVVFHNSVYSFTKFYTTIQTQVIADDIIARTVIQIDILTMVATHTVVLNGNGLYHIEKR